jgi:hypothetical protein
MSESLNAVLLNFRHERRVKIGKKITFNLFGVEALNLELGDSPRAAEAEMALG